MSIKHIDSYRGALLDEIKEGKGADVQNYLLPATRTKIREAVLYRYAIIKQEKGLLEKDKKVLEEFIGRQKELSIERLEEKGIGSYKALEKFLQGKSVNSRPRQLNLLAWLIDFEPRPYINYLLQKRQKAISHPFIRDEALSLINDSDSLKRGKMGQRLIASIRILLDFLDEIEEVNISEFFNSFATDAFRAILNHWGEENIEILLADIIDEKLNGYVEQLNNKKSKGRLKSLLWYFFPLPSIENIKDELYDELCYELEDLGIDKIEFYEDNEDNEDNEDDDDYDDEDPDF